MRVLARRGPGDRVVGLALRGELVAHAHRDGRELLALKGVPRKHSEHAVPHFHIHTVVATQSHNRVGDYVPLVSKDV